MNKVASFAAVLALIAMGAYFYSAPNRSGSAVDNTTPAGLSSAEGGSCCSQGASQVATAAVKSSCCSEGATQMVSAGGESCCAGKTEACCSEKTEKHVLINLQEISVPFLNHFIQFYGQEGWCVNGFHFQYGKGSSYLLWVEFLSQAMRTTDMYSLGSFL